jgi:hypothetical protein
VEASLRRLRTERIDLYQMHWPAGDGTLMQEPFPSWLCFAELQYVDGPGELAGAPGGKGSRPAPSSTSPPLA